MVDRRRSSAGNRRPVDHVQGLGPVARADIRCAGATFEIPANTFTGGRPRDRRHGPLLEDD
ncbi:hypothetical protein C485_05241 [Natrinema altunense JCM 12890]|uniref:Uncharacterized protein n=1 Tax=Natrinema altunense (strain JCM 12890 / CGMCC 1.3731 / AJ2) TaxID=1227494 RepID=L9ZVT3_NATA2|nr:hypothetical protein C485_05241 [Natrinema altunense JCM 12890]